MRLHDIPVSVRLFPLIKKSIFNFLWAAAANNGPLFRFVISNRLTPCRNKHTQTVTLFYSFIIQFYSSSWPNSTIPSDNKIIKCQNDIRPFTKKAIFVRGKRQRSQRAWPPPTCLQYSVNSQTCWYFWTSDLWEFNLYFKTCSFEWWKW